MLLLCMHARFMRQFSMGLAMHATDRIVWFRFVLVCLVRCLLETSLSACPLAPCISYPLPALVTSRVFRATQSVHACICMIDDVMDHLISRNATDAEARAALAFSSSNVFQFQHVL